MKIISFETSTKIASVSLVKDGKLISEYKNNELRSHSEFMNSALSLILSNHDLSISDIDHFCCGIGPGSFTGIRTSINIVRTLCYLNNKSFFLADSLKILNFQNKKLILNQYSISMINAYKNMIYFSIFKGESLIKGPSVIRVKDLESLICELKIVDKIICIGDGFSFYQNLFSSNLKKLLVYTDQSLDFPLSSELALLSVKENTWSSDWKFIIPLYIRASEAEENFEVKISR